MHTLIETLNGLGERLCSFGWPMLWQSSLLLVIVFCLDYLLARKVRAAVRYALWLVVLLKLVLPPTLASPTSAAWWLSQPKPAPAPVVKHFTVTYGETVSPLDFTPQSVPLPAPPPKLQLAGWLLIAASAVSVVLLVWMCIRWWQVTRMVWKATPMNAETVILASAGALAGRCARVKLKIVEGRMSPAVCGLFRPVILLPRKLVEKLSSEQLHVVLLHELFHLRRGDVWMNCAQALLQIVYWWHPLLWVANARIRRLREEAVDDSVMLALRDHADAYAPTLLEVAKLAFRRPLLSLGLVGIMESRSALRQRIERLVDFRAPRKAGLTIVSFLAICIFSAVALPMGEAPSAPDAKDESVMPAVAKPASSTPTNAPQVLIQAEIYRMQQDDFEKLASDPEYVATKQDKVKNFQKFEQLLKASGFQPVQRPRILTSSGVPAQIYVGNKTNSFEFKCVPTVTNGLIDLASTVKASSAEENSTYINFNDHFALENGGGHVFSIRPAGQDGSNLVVLTISAEVISNKARFQQRLVAIIHRSGGTDGSNTTGNEGNAAGRSEKAAFGRQEIIQKLNSIRLDHVSYNHLPLDEVLRRLSVEIKKRDPDKEGVNFLLQTATTPSADLPMVDPQTGLPKPAEATPAGSDDINSALVNLPNLTDVRACDVLDAIVLTADKPIKYAVKDFAVVFSPKGTEVEKLFSRVFKVDEHTFMSKLKESGLPSVKSTNASVAVREFFTDLGVDFTSPPGKTVFYNDKLGKLFVKATENDLDTIERALDVLMPQPPQIHIKARFVAVPRDSSGLNLYLGQFPAGASVGNAPAFPGSAGSTADPGRFSSIGLPGTNANVAKFMGILTDSNFQTIWKALVSRKGVEIVAEPEVITTSGRQTQMRVTEVATVVTNFVLQANPTNGQNSVVPQVETLEIGPVLDVVPYVLSDGYTINLSIIPSITDFLGYDKPPDVPNVIGTNNEVQIPVVLPRFRRRQMVASFNVWDGQTVVVGGLPEKTYVGGKETAGKSKRDDMELLLFITANIVDPAGNRVHTDADLPFAQTGIPSQPPHAK